MYTDDGSYSNALNKMTNSVAPYLEDAEIFARERLSERCMKKYIFEDSVLAEKSIQSFLAVNQMAKDVNLQLTYEELSNGKEFIHHVLALCTYRFSDNPTPGVVLDTGIIFDNWRLGPGASNEVVGTHFVQKISQNMTCTKRLEPFIRILRKTTPRLKAHDNEHKSSGTSVIKGSHLLTVPKNQETYRVLAKEPSGNMALQLSLNTYLTNALKLCGIDLSSQWIRNKLLACRGSIDDSLATIDLKNASDLVTPALIKALWPPEWYYLLDLCRSDKIQLPNGSWRKLHMMSTQGNGFTFPMMTLTIVALLYIDQCKYASSTRRLFVNWTDSAVFGDDIILPSHRYEAFTNLLERAGLVVNHDKSYSQGPFRESCGGDYYKGVDVTPFYIKSLANDSDIYTAINQCLRWQAAHKVADMSLLDYLYSLLSGKALLVPQWESDNSGIRCEAIPKRRYVKLVPEMIYHNKTLDEDLAILVIVMGYVNSRRSDEKTVTSKGIVLNFLPRSHVVRYRRKNCRIPKGYANGYDPYYLGPSKTRYASILIELLQTQLP